MRAPVPSPIICVPHDQTGRPFPFRQEWANDKLAIAILCEERSPRCHQILAGWTTAIACAYRPRAPLSHLPIQHRLVHHCPDSG